MTFTWQRWPAGDSLIILDDVTDYAAIFPYLPPPSQKFKILITTRINLGSSVTQIEIEQLSDQAAIELLKSIVGIDRIDAQLTFAEALCHKVGNLPLGLELLGRFLARKKDWTIQKLAKRLESKKLETKALKATELGMTAELGVAKALELSWIELNEAQQKLACVLGMFAVAPIPWHLVETCYSEQNKDDLENIRDEGLIDNSLLKRVGQETYQLHQIVQEFFRVKLNERSDDRQLLKEVVCSVMLDVAQGIDSSPTLDVIVEMRVNIPHLEEAVKVWGDHLRKDKLIWSYIGICRFYAGQGSYGLALPWIQICYQQVKDRQGEENLDIATCNLWLGYLYRKQGQYKDAESAYLKALEMYQKLKEDLHVAKTLNNLALLYVKLSRYEEAEPIYLQALEMRKQHLGNENPDIAEILIDIAEILNNLAILYRKTDRYNKAKQLCVQALKMRKQCLGNEHPDIAESLNNLAKIYDSQGQFKEAEKFYLQALRMIKTLKGAEHPHVASNLNNLALLYAKLGRYGEAEPIYLQALEMRKNLLGDEHPSVANTMWCLGALYQKQGRNEDAEGLYRKALVIFEEKLEVSHPDTISLQSDLTSLS